MEQVEVMRDRPRLERIRRGTKRVLHMAAVGTFAFGLTSTLYYLQADSEQKAGVDASLPETIRAEHLNRAEENRNQQELFMNITFVFGYAAVAATGLIIALSIPKPSEGDPPEQPANPSP